MSSRVSPGEVTRVDAEGCRGYTRGQLPVLGAPLQLYRFDEQYIRRLHAGDPDTQHHFVAYFKDLIRMKGRARSLSPDHIEEVCQETFVRVFTSLQKGGIQHPERLGAFVNSVCNHVLLERYRVSKRTVSMDEDFDAVDNRIDLDRALISDQAQREVEAILAKMKERDRRILRAVFLEELDKDEVCREYGVERSYLRVLLHRAKQQFRTQMVQRQDTEAT